MRYLDNPNRALRALDVGSGTVAVAKNTGLLGNVVVLADLPPKPPTTPRGGWTWPWDPKGPGGTTGGGPPTTAADCPGLTKGEIEAFEKQCAAEAKSQEAIDNAQCEKDHGVPCSTSCTTEGSTLEVVVEGGECKTKTRCAQTCTSTFAVPPSTFYGG
jgi:hypothetical protein